jgi:hypothetical protein
MRTSRITVLASCVSIVLCAQLACSSDVSSSKHGAMGHDHPDGASAFTPPESEQEGEEPRGDSDVSRSDGAARDSGQSEDSAPPTLREFDTFEQLLQSCPTPQEIALLRKDFDIVFDPEVVAAGALVTCTDGGAESSAVLSTYNMLRAARMVRFDTPLPLIGATDLYAWLQSSKITIHVFPATTAVSPYASGTTVNLPSFLLSDPSKRHWYDDAFSGGLINAVAVLVHEVRHTVPGGGLPHDCGTNDSTFAYGGAWAMHYYIWIWMADHLVPVTPGVALMSDAAREQARKNAASILATNFCK